MAIRIYIDQGHNPQGVNAGGEGFGYREQDIVYEIGMNLAAFLNGDTRFEALVSRPTPETSLGATNAESLQIRVAQANNWPANYFLSLHTNASIHPGQHGTEMYVYSETSPSYILAQYLQDAIVHFMGTRNNGVFVNSSLYVLRNTAMPAVLLELAYITNAGDLELLVTRKSDFAYAIYVGLLEYFGLGL